MHKKTKYIFVYITCASEQQAKDIAKTLLNQSLISCANIFPIQSIYWWENKLQESNEWVLLLKTTAKTYPTIQEKVTKAHTYSIPCITKIPIEPNPPYANWLTQQLLCKKPSSLTKNISKSLS